MKNEFVRNKNNQTFACVKKYIENQPVSIPATPLNPSIGTIGYFKYPIINKEKYKSISPKSRRDSTKTNGIIQSKSIENETLSIRTRATWIPDTVNSSNIGTKHKAPIRQILPDNCEEAQINVHSNQSFNNCLVASTNNLAGSIDLCAHNEDRVGNRTNMCGQSNTYNKTGRATRRQYKMKKRNKKTVDFNRIPLLYNLIGGNGITSYNSDRRTNASTPNNEILNNLTNISGLENLYNIQRHSTWINRIENDINKPSTNIVNNSNIVVPIWKPYLNINEEHVLQTVPNFGAVGACQPYGNPTYDQNYYHSSISQQQPQHNAVSSLFIEHAHNDSNTLHQQQMNQQRLLEATTAIAQIPQPVPAVGPDVDSLCLRSSPSNIMPRKRTIFDHQSIRPTYEASPMVIMDDVPGYNESTQPSVSNHGIQTFTLVSNRSHFIDQMLYAKLMKSEIPTTVITPSTKIVSSEQTAEQISCDASSHIERSSCVAPIMLQASTAIKIDGMERKTIASVSNFFEIVPEQLQWIISTSMEDEPECGIFVDSMQEKLYCMYRTIYRQVTEEHVFLQESDYYPNLSLTKLLFEMSYLQRNGYKSPKGVQVFENAVNRILIRLQNYMHAQEITTKDELLASLILYALKYRIRLPRILDGYTVILNGNYEQLEASKKDLIKRYERHLKEEEAKLKSKWKPLQVSATEYIVNRLKNVKHQIHSVIPTIIISDSEDE